MIDCSEAFERKYLGGLDIGDIEYFYEDKDTYLLRYNSKSYFLIKIYF